jgi:hypothetical protein
MCVFDCAWVGEKRERDRDPMLFFVCVCVLCLCVCVCDCEKELPNDLFNVLFSSLLLTKYSTDIRTFLIMIRAA